MSIVGTVDSLWRYPVKSMRGEEIEEAFVGFPGVYGDRLFAFKDASAIAGFPYLTGRENPQMLLCRPRFRHPDKAAKPLNLAEAEDLAPGATPIFAAADEFALDVELPSGETLAIDDAALIERLTEGLADKHDLSLMRSDRAFTDCRPVSLFSLQTASQLGEEVGSRLDKRCFRANIYADFDGADGFAENAFLGKTLQIGSKVALSIVERDPRCMMITFDPDTGEANPEVLKRVVKDHEGKAGIYGAVLVEGCVRPGDEIKLLN